MVCVPQYVCDSVVCVEGGGEGVWGGGGGGGGGGGEVRIQNDSEL